MPSRNVAIQQGVYEALAKEKRRGESFTQLFRRLLEHGGGLDEVVGAWGPSDRRADLGRLRVLRQGGRRP